MTSPTSAQRMPVQPQGSPVSGYLAQARPGTSTTGDYLVLPRSVLERLPFHVQSHVAAALAEVHAAMPPDWTPLYQVTPRYWKELESLGPDDLEEVGVIAELDAAGEMVYRDRRSGRQLDSEQRVLAAVTDPLVGR